MKISSFSGVTDMTEEDIISETQIVRIVTCFGFLVRIWRESLNFIMFELKDRRYD